MKHVVIIGASSGIGSALAQRLLKSGIELTVFSRRRPEIESEHIAYFPYDVLSDADQLPVSDRVVDGFVYMPGNIRLKPFKSLKDDEFLEDWKINFLGAVKTFRHFLPQLLKSTSASALFFSTVAGTIGMPFHSSIAAAKSAVEGLTRSLAAEFAPKIRINCIAPSLTKTPLSEYLTNNEQKLIASIDRHPLKRIGQPDDVAAFAEFLLSDKAEFITGQVIRMDGGISTVKI